MVALPPPLRKYPRTPHIEGSRVQPGDEDLECVPFAAVAGRHVVVAEKVDGANVAISFGADGATLLQCRERYLDDDTQESQFDLFIDWARAHAAVFHAVLGARYVLYGEWLYAKRAIFYDRLPHYFLEFDVLDRATGAFLGTEERRRLLRSLPLHSVPVLFAGELAAPADLVGLLGPSRYIGPAWASALGRACESRGLDADRVLRETDHGGAMEGLYVKVEDAGVVVARYKYVRASFPTYAGTGDDTWVDRPIVPNRLRMGAHVARSRVDTVAGARRSPPPVAGE